MPKRLIKFSLSGLMALFVLAADLEAGEGEGRLARKAMDNHHIVTVDHTKQALTLSTMLARSRGWIVRRSINSIERSDSASIASRHRWTIRP